jgi:hypothetical protein
VKALPPKDVATTVEGTLQNEKAPSDRMGMRLDYQYPGGPLQTIEVGQAGVANSQDVMFSEEGPHPIMNFLAAPLFLLYRHFCFAIREVFVDVAA